MKKYILTEEQFRQIVTVLNEIHVTGIEQARRLSFIAAILDDMKVEEEQEEE